jgi:hypothetical protein
MAAILSVCAWGVGVGTGLTAAAIWASLARPAFVCYAVRARGIDAYVSFFFFILFIFQLKIRTGLSGLAIVGCRFSYLCVI